MIFIIPFGPFEAATNLSIEALMGQIDILDALGPSSQRASFIERLKAQANYLFDLIEKAEEIFIEEIEKYSNEVLDHTASVRDSLIKVSKRIDDPDLRKIVGVVSEAHGTTVKLLGGEEQEMINKIRERTAVMKNMVKKLMEQIERVHVH